MKVSFIACLLVLNLTAISQARPAANKWIQLFNGKDLKDWKVKIKDHPLNENFGNTFRVENGKLKVSYDKYAGFKEQFGHLFYKKPFSAYLLVIEYRFTGKQVEGGPGWAVRNSGAMLHSPAPETMKLEQDFPISLEMQLLGGNGIDERHTANLCTPGTNVVMNKKLFTPHCVDSKSNSYHGEQWVRAGALVLRDSLIHHIVEGDTVLTYRKPQYDGRDKWVQAGGFKDGALIRQGYISLQSESHPIEFRKVAVFNLEPYMKDPKKLRSVLQKLKAETTPR
ncbi:MAG: DUF1080 domain-containing protein [Chitinophagaceae bacterium]